MGSKKPIQRALLGYHLKSKRYIQLFRQTACLMAWLEKLKKSSEIYAKNISFKILSSLYCSAESSQQSWPLEHSKLANQLHKYYFKLRYFNSKISLEVFQLIGASAYKV
jgi:hypothetical protein